MHKKWLLLDPAEGDATGGGGGAEGSTGGEVFEGAGDAPTGEGAPASDTPTATGAATAGAAAAVPLTAESIADAMKKAGLGQQSALAAPAAPAKQYTQEDYDRVFNVIRPTKAQYLQIRGEDEGAALAALTELLHGAAKMASTMSAYQLEQLKEELLGEVAPLKTFVSKAREQELRGEFFKAYPDLKSYEQVLSAVVAEMKQSGFNGTQDEAFKQAADRTRGIIKAAGGGAAPAAGAAGGNGTTTPRTMSSVSAGGQAGGGAASRGAAGTKSKSPGMAVFD